ncbi:MAG: HAMP domain-containing protein [Bacteroidetes bacterium]|nr:HAMP domain-containing protein [Bacteroidota bacterium]
MKLPATKLKTKLQLAFVSIGFISIFITGWQAYENARTALEEVTFQRLTAVRESRRRQIEFYFERIRSDVVSYSNDQLVIRAAKLLTVGSGGKDGAMASYDRDIRAHLDQQGYYDIFLVTPSGDVIYTVKHEADFGTNLRSGPYRDSNIAEVYRAAAESTDRQFARFVDFKPYQPSGFTPAAFVASPVYDGDRMLAVLIFQISIDDINAVMTENSNWQSEGFGQSGETYIVGTDHRMRNDSRFFIEQPRAYYRTLESVGTDSATIGAIRRHRTSVLLQEVRTEATEAALAGRTDTRNVLDYRGVRVLSSFAPLDIPDLHWVMLSEIDEIEAFRSVYTLREQLILSGLIILLFAVGLGFGISQTISRPIQALTTVTEKFGRGDLDNRADVGARDEIGLLAQTFNTMADKIKSHTQQLEEEVQVRRRTEEELVHSQELFRNLSRHLQTVREEERKGIAREIHDELGQNLTTLKLHLSLLIEDLPEDTAAPRAKFQAIIEDIDVTIQSVKRLISDLRPGLLDDLGLVAAIEWQAEEFQRRTGIHCDLHIDPPDISLDADRSTAVFRIFQETLTNIARHAQADRVMITLHADDAAIMLQVRDNGRGISSEDISAPRSFGLMGIRERAHYWGGATEIHGASGSGTTVTVTIPLDHAGATS